MYFCVTNWQILSEKLMGHKTSSNAHIYYYLMCIYNYLFYERRTAYLILKLKKKKVKLLNLLLYDDYYWYSTWTEKSGA